MKFKALAALAVAASSVALVAPVAHASTGGASLTVSPTRVEIALAPGKTITQKFLITAGDVPVMVSGNVVPFTQNDKGQTTTSTVPKAVSGVTWVRLPRPFKLKAHQTKNVAIKITEPTNPQPGQKYVAVVWIETAHTTNAKGDHVNVSGSVAGEMILDVPGKITHGVTYGLSVPSFTWGGTTTATISAKNTGNTLVTLNGQSVMVNGTARKLPGALLLGGASKVQSGQVPLSWGINHITYNGVSKTVIALPGELLGLGAGFLVLIVGIVIIARRSGRNSVRRAGRHA